MRQVNLLQVSLFEKRENLICGAPIGNVAPRGLINRLRFGQHAIRLRFCGTNVFAFTADLRTVMFEFPFTREIENILHLSRTGRTRTRPVCCGSLCRRPVVTNRLEFVPVLVQLLAIGRIGHHHICAVRNTT